MNKIDRYKRPLSGLLPLIAAVAISVTTLPATEAEGREVRPAKLLYGFYCAQCHGVNGDGKGVNATEEMPATPRDHTSAKGMSELTDADILYAIRGGGVSMGKSEMMPPFASTLSNDEILGLRDYLRELCKCEGPK